MKKQIFLSLLLLLFTISSPVIAEGQYRSHFQCGAEVVNKGEFMESVIGKCGEPSSQSGSEIFGRQALHYNCGEGNFNHTLRFQNGKLHAIVRDNVRGSGLPDWQRKQ